MNTDQPNGVNIGSSSKLREAELSEQIIGAYYAVYNELGHGFTESVYQRAMAIALRTAGLEVVREMHVPVWFRGEDVGNFKADIVVNGRILVELKAVSALDRTHEAQLYNYLRATEIELGLLFNFGGKPQFRRIVLDNDKKKIRVRPCSSVVRSGL